MSPPEHNSGQFAQVGLVTFLGICYFLIVIIGPVFPFPFFLPTLPTGFNAPCRDGYQAVLLPSSILISG